MRPAMNSPSRHAPPATARWHPASIALHWLLALMILGSLGVGLTMTGLPLSPLRLQLYNWHKWAA